MLQILLNKALPILCALLLLSCEPDGPDTFSSIPALISETSGTSRSEDLLDNQLLTLAEDSFQFENLQNLVLQAVNRTECGATKFSLVSGQYFEKLLANPQSLEHLSHYTYLNRQAAKLGIGSDYFGSDGNHTSLVKKLERDLGSFWSLSRKIEVLGQHNVTLENRENLASIYWYSIEDMESREEAYHLADKIIELNEKFPELIASPFISNDGFAARNGKIVLGDGLVQLFVETGLNDEIVWTGILAHEWAHQVQFEYLNFWYPDEAFTDIPEKTRMLELEADFFSGYYMTHKRGGTYNWKRAEEFFELFYQAGDCSFEFEQHHGTPLQRKKASHQGYLLAESAKKKGKILSAQELHEIFISEVLPLTVYDLQYF